MDAGFVVWFTGLPGSGKTTIANALARAIRQQGCEVEVLDSEEIRRKIYADLGFSREDREANLERLAFIAGLLMRHGIVVIVAAVSPYREERERVRSQLERFAEVYLRCPLDVCAERHETLYRQARSGDIPDMTGVSSPYEEPERPDVLLTTDRLSPEECVERILAFLIERDWISPEGHLSQTDEEQVRRRLEALGYL